MKTARHSRLYHQLRMYFGQVTPQPPAAHHSADAGGTGEDQVPTQLVIMRFQPGKRGGQFGPCGSNEQNAHTANIRKPRHSQANCNFAAISCTMVYLTRSEHFNAAHKLYNPNWSPEQNEAVFGKCANENWHGHNYELLVTVKGQPDPGTGFVFDVKRLSTIIKEQIIEKLDHRNLNLDVDFMQGKMCSTENLAIAIWQQLKPHLPESLQLHCIKLYETPRIYVEYFGDV
jgi:6-pyruvoyltetrahydropterin/6-carboxytetrahydropterin synthase